MSHTNDFSPLGPAAPLAIAAIELGGRAAASGDPTGAGELFACTARLVRRVRGLSEVADFRLERALDEAESNPDAAAGASALHEAFDSLLPDADPEPTTDDPLQAAQRFVQLAISIGAPAYNLEDRQGCFDVYACTARMILATLTGADAARARLRAALDECATLDDANRQAWAMRHAFDAVLEMPGATGAALAPTEVRRLLMMAIAIGAPAFDHGDTRGCFEVYACAARLVIHSTAVAEATADRLRTALAAAAVLPDVARQAWVLRHAFDAILDAPAAAPDTEAAD